MRHVGALTPWSKPVPLPGFALAAQKSAPGQAQAQAQSRFPPKDTTERWETPDRRAEPRYGALELRVGFEPDPHLGAVSRADTTTVVRDPEGHWHCDDDFEGLNPGVVFQRQLFGSYSIWVRTLERGPTQPAVVRISEVPPRRR